MLESICQSHYEQLNMLAANNAIYNPKPENYNEDIYLTLTNLTTAYFSFVRDNKDFYRIIMTNFSMPPSSEVFSIVEKYHFIQFDIIEKMFRSMAKAHGNLKGKSKTLTWSFIGTVNAYISLYFNGVSLQALNEKAVKELVYQFMHGVFA